MSMWTAIAVISVAGIIAGIFSDRNKRRNREEISEEFVAMQAKIDQLDTELRSRVETLERIVTNPRDDLKRQFDHLDKAS